MFRVLLLYFILFFKKFSLSLSLVKKNEVEEMLVNGELVMMYP